MFAISLFANAGDILPNNQLMPFPELPLDDKMYILDCIGGVRSNQPESDNRRIQCFCTPAILQRSSDGKQIFTRDRAKQISADLAVGYLPAIYTGQVFKNRCRMPSVDLPEVEEITITLDPKLAFSASMNELNLTYPLVSEKHDDLAKNVRFTKVECKLLQTTFPKHQWSIGKACEVVFPDIELIRFYFTNSSFSCRKIFSGSFTSEKIGIDVVNEKDEDVSFDQTTRIGRFVHRMGYSPNDISTLGRILFEEDGYALKAVQKIFKQITADLVNLRPAGLGFPSTYFPFKTSANLSVQGRRVPYGDGKKKNYIFLVSRILRCSGLFPFSSLSYSSEMAPGGPPAPENAPFVFANQDSRHRGPAHESEHIGLSQSGERPDAASIALNIELGERQFDDLKGKEILPEKRRASTHRSRNLPTRYLTNLLNASTGQGTTGATSTVRQKLSEDIVVPVPLSTDLETFLKALDHISEIEKSWKLKMVHVGDIKNLRKDEKSSLLISLFPLVVCPVKNMFRKFSYMDDIRKNRKRLICVEVKIDGRYFYMLEAERRLDIKITSGKLPILLLHRAGYTQASAEDFSEMLILTVNNGTWPQQQEVSSFTRDFTVHGMGAESAADIAQRLVEMVKRNDQPTLQNSS